MNDLVTKEKSEFEKWLEDFTNFYFKDAKYVNSVFGLNATDSDLEAIRYLVSFTARRTSDYFSNNLKRKVCRFECEDQGICINYVNEHVIDEIFK